MREYKSFFDYEFDLGQNVVARSFDDFGVDLTGKSILDVGCGEGGVLRGLADLYNFTGLGIDYDATMIEKCRPKEGLDFKVADFLDEDIKGIYDVVILRDVLEHCGQPMAFLKKIRTLLSQGSIVYVTYAPFLGPFGGHQHNGNGLLSNLPFIHYLPEKLFLKLIAPKGNWYKEKESLLKDFHSIRKTCLTTGLVRRICQRTGLNIEKRRAYLVRPDYRFKFGLRPANIPSAIPIGTATDIFSTGVEMLLSPV
jgi:SAM-dependent methyltransferase